MTHFIKKNKKRMIESDRLKNRVFLSVFSFKPIFSCKFVHNILIYIAQVRNIDSSTLVKKYDPKISKFRKILINSHFLAAGLILFFPIYYFFLSWIWLLTNNPKHISAANFSEYCNRRYDSLCQKIENFRFWRSFSTTGGHFSTIF